MGLGFGALGLGFCSEQEKGQPIFLMCLGLLLGLNPTPLRPEPLNLNPKP